MNKLENILDESLLHSASGDRKALRLLLKKVIPHRFHYYHESRNITRQEEYAVCCTRFSYSNWMKKKRKASSWQNLLIWASASVSRQPGTHLRVPQKAYHPDALFRGLFHG